MAAGSEISLPPLVKGKRKYSHCKQLYTDIHQFIASMEWAPINEQNKIGGATQMELFTPFDITATRSTDGGHTKDPEAPARAKKKKTKEAQKKKNGHEDATTKPNLDEELAKPQAKMRDITHHEASHQDARMFKAEKRVELRRLAG